MKNTTLAVVSLLVFGAANAQAEVRCKLTANERLVHEASAIAEIPLSSTLLEAKIGDFTLIAKVDEDSLGTAKQPNVWINVSDSSKIVVIATGALGPTKLNLYGEKAYYSFSARNGTTSVLCVRYETLDDVDKTFFDVVRP